jgi:dCTP deaminase
MLLFAFKFYASTRCNTFLFFVALRQRSSSAQTGNCPMILSGKEIARRIGKDIIIEPFNPEQLNPNSYNLRLHDELLVYSDPVLDMKKPNAYERIRIPEEGLVLEPNKLYLGRTMEYTATEGLVPMLEGRSSVGRLGLFVHVTAGFGDVGFAGYWTLEIFCVQPIRIYAGVEICQIYYHTIEGDYERYRSGKYQNNRDVQPSLLYKDFEKKK